MSQGFLEKATKPHLFGAFTSHSSEKRLQQKYTWQKYSSVGVRDEIFQLAVHADVSTHKRASVSRQ